MIGADLQDVNGSSPRGRGTLTWPAPNWPALTVHPRVGGEHSGCFWPLLNNFGSSPRGRGTPKFARGRTRLRRFIPAWAGNTLIGMGSSTAGTVHPRVGGEHTAAAIRIRHFSGSSPRGRGTRSHNSLPNELWRFIPAWAGNTRGLILPCLNCSVHPRVGGEHRNPPNPPCQGGGSSPRGRGTYLYSGYLYSVLRFIPAWAGNTCGRSSSSGKLPVHPRVGGEHDLAGTDFQCADGSSPRGRGTRYV